MKMNWFESILYYQLVLIKLAILKSNSRFPEPIVRPPRIEARSNPQTDCRPCKQAIQQVFQKFCFLQLHQHRPYLNDFDLSIIYHFCSYLVNVLSLIPSRKQKPVIFRSCLIVIIYYLKTNIIGQWEWDSLYFSETTLEKHKKMIYILECSKYYGWFITHTFLADQEVIYYRCLNCYEIVGCSGKTRLFYLELINKCFTFRFTAPSTIMSLWRPTSSG
jgi:hypothetical protein